MAGPLLHALLPTACTTTGAPQPPVRPAPRGTATRRSRSEAPPRYFGLLQARALLERLLLGGFMALTLLALIVGLFLAGQPGRQEAAVGASASVAAVSFYAARERPATPAARGRLLLRAERAGAAELRAAQVPLSTALKVYRTGDAASLSVPLCLTSLANAGLWMVYGIAMGDPAIAVPSTLGVLCGSLQLALIYKFGTLTLGGFGALGGGGGAAAGADAGGDFRILDDGPAVVTAETR